MKLNSSKLLIALLILCLFSVYGLNAASASLDTGSIANTVPTRTPIPQPTEVPPEPTAKPPEPTNEPSSNNGGQDNNQPPPTNTPILPTATSEPVNIAPTPVNGFVEPARCGDPFFVATLGTVNVRSAPSTEGEIVSKMVYLEARQVLGRWADDAWWKILLPDTSTGWVYDSTGSMIGIMEVIPVINADGSESTQPIWQPTPDLVCPTVEPTATATATATETAVPTETPEPTQTASPQPTAAQKAAISNDADSSGSADPAPTIEATIDPNIISALPQSADSPVESAIIVERESSQKQEVPSSVSTSGSSIGTSNGPLVSWPIILGILLILFGVTTLIIQRRRGNAS